MTTLSLEQIYCLPENTLDYVVTSGGVEPSSDYKYKRLQATLVYYNSNAVQPEDALLVTQPAFNQLYLSPDEELVQKVQEKGETVALTMTRFDLIRFLLATRSPQITSPQPTKTTQPTPATEQPAFNIQQCENLEDDQVMDPILMTEVPEQYLYPLQAGNNMYCYDLRSLYQLVKENPINPMTQQRLTEQEIASLTEAVKDLTVNISLITRDEDMIGNLSLNPTESVDDLYIRLSNLISPVPINTIRDASIEALPYLFTYQGQSLVDYLGQGIYNLIDEPEATIQVEQFTNNDATAQYIQSLNRFYDYLGQVWMGQGERGVPRDHIKEKLQQIYHAVVDNRPEQAFDLFSPAMVEKYQLLER